MADQIADDPAATAPGEYSIRVLLVDDQAMIGEAVRRALAGQPNLEFHYCGDSADAMAAAEQFRPSVILPLRPACGQVARIAPAPSLI